MREQKINLSVKIIFIFIIFIIIILTLIYLGRAFKNLDYFRIKDIAATQSNIIDISYLKGQNIFAVDLERQASYLSEVYPTYKKIRLIRILPSRLFVDFIKRQPLAYLRLYKYFSVDEDGVLFDAPTAAEALELPVILGLETKIFGPKVGKRFNIKELSLALSMIKQMQANRSLRVWKIKKIDVTSPANASFFMSLAANTHGLLPVRAKGELEPTEVKIGQDAINDKIDLLANLLIQLKNDWINIKYVDLRFKEPVVRFKDKDAKK